MKLYPLLFLTVLMAVVASADVSIVNDVLFNLDNSAFIKVLAVQNSANITIYNSTNIPASNLQFYINETPIRFNANTNKTLSNISYNDVTDVVTYIGNGTTGYLNVSARMNLSLRYYDFEVDGIVNQTLLSNASGWVAFNYTGWIPNQHNFRISRTGAPNITSWSNNKTNNDSLTLTINTSEFINFNATANQSIDTWSWFKDEANQSNNYDNFTTSFIVGIHTIKVNATNVNGTSNTITWTVTVQAVAAAPNITSWGNNKTNNNTLNLTINASEVINFNATANQSIDTWNWFKDDAVLINNYDNFTTNFTSGAHTIKVNATNNANGTSNTITWNVTAQAIRGVSLRNITALSQSTNAGTNATYLLNLTNNGTDPDTYTLVVTNANSASTALLNISLTQSLNAGQSRIFALNVTNTSAGSGTFKVNVSATSSDPTKFAYVNTTTTVIVVFAPNITSWGNNKSNNQNLTLTINTSEAIRFNATANQTIDVWNWYKDDVNQNNSYDNFTTSFDSAGSHTIKVSATNNSNGTSTTLTWTVTVPGVPGVPNITSWGNNKTNNQSLTLTINTSEAVRFNATANQTIDVWNWYKDDVNQNNNYDNLTTSFTSAGSHIIKVSATNNSNGTSTNITWTVSVPATTIIINITSPANNSVNTTGYVNVTVTLDVPGTALLNWDGANESMNGAGIDFYKNKTGLLSDNYTFKVYANDTGGLSNASETRIVTVNRTIVDSTIGSFINTSTFVVNTTLEIVAPSGNVTVTIPGGTNASIGGEALTSISVDSVAKLNSTCVANLPTGDKLIGENLTVGPENARFSPDIQLRFNYTQSQIAPLGVTESELTVKFCNLTTNTWEPLTIFDRNTINHYLVANISHFSTFALIGTPTAAPAPAPIPGTVSGGGGGGGVISPEPPHNIEMYEVIEEYLGAGVPVSYIFTAPSLVISEVLITPAKSFGTTSIRVEVLKDISQVEGVTPPSGIVYKYVDIWVGAKELERVDSIVDAFIGFKVEHNWLAENNLEEGSIKLLRWNGSKWVLLDTVPKSRDDTFVYYEAKTNAFSPFAIVAVPIYPVATIQITETPTIESPFQKMARMPATQWLYIFTILLLAGILLYSLIYSTKIGEGFEKPEEIPEKAPDVHIIEKELEKNRMYIEKYKESLKKIKENLKEFKNR